MSEILKYSTETQGEGTIQLKCLFDSYVAKHLEESPLHDTQTLTPQADGCIQLIAEVEDTAQLRWWLLEAKSRLLNQKICEMIFIKYCLKRLRNICDGLQKKLIQAKVHRCKLWMINYVDSLPPITVQRVGNESKEVESCKYYEAKQDKMASKMSLPYGLLSK